MVVRVFTKADYPAISRIALQVQPETQLTVARLYEADQNRAQHLKSGGLLAEIEGYVVGYVRYTQYADLYQPERVVISGAVSPDYQKQGVGSELLAALEHHLLTIDVFQMQTSETSTEILSFLQRRGFAETWRRLEYRLNVCEADSSSLEVLALKLERQGVLIKTYLDLATDQSQDEKLRLLNWRLEQDVPHGKQPTELDLEAFLRERLEPKAVLKDAFYIATDDEAFIGMSSL